MEYIQQNPVMPILTDPCPFVAQKTKTEEQTIRDLAQEKLIEVNDQTAIVSKPLHAVREESGQEKKETSSERIAAQLFAFRETQDEPEIDQEMENELEEILQSNLVEMPSNSAFIGTDLMILKNDYKGTMPINGIKEEAFKEISALFEAICTKSSSLKIMSDPSFSNKIEEAIKTLLTREIGRKLIRKICNFNNPIRIGKGEECGFVRSIGIINIDKQSLDNRIIVNVMDPDPRGNRRIELDGKQPVKAGFEPLFVILAHEMIHAIHFHEDPQMLVERAAIKDEQYDNKEEKFTIEGFCLNLDGQLIYDELNERTLTGAFADKKQQIGYPRCDHRPGREKLEIEGKIIYPDGTVFEGKFENGKLNGQGKITSSDGRTVAEGEFKDGELNGQGQFRSSDGRTVAKGEFKDGKLNGQGKVFSSNGVLREGKFKAGELNGQGKMTFSNGKTLEGEFENGLLNGQGKATYPDGKVKEGEFENGKLNGRGKATYPNGKVKEGEFENGLLNGQGKITHPNGIILEGEFEIGLLNGQGKLTYLDGKVGEGEFENGRLNGQGKITYPDGKVEEGEFKDGELNGQGKSVFLME
jgi:hypothetical protein